MLVFVWKRESNLAVYYWVLSDLLLVRCKILVVKDCKCSYKNFCLPCGRRLLLKVQAQLVWFVWSSVLRLWICFRLEPAESLEENQRSLLQMTEKFFHAIINSSSEFPPQLRSVCHCLYQVCLQWVPAPELWGLFFQFWQLGLITGAQWYYWKTSVRSLVNSRDLSLKTRCCCRTWAGSEEVTKIFSFFKELCHG